MIPSPRVLDDWREALVVRAENALIHGVVTRREALAILAYVKALEEENAWLDKALEQEVNRGPRIFDGEDES